MPGKRITDHQVHKFKQHRNTLSQAAAAAKSFSQWGEVFVEPAMTLAAVDRLVHHSTILEMNVESYRRRAAHSAGAPAAGKNR